ncbi:MAG: ribosome silencing factor [Planctomycetota bacterium]
MDTELNTSAMEADIDPELPASMRFAIMAARELTDRKCENATVLDVRGLSQVCDFVVVATGTSDRQAKSAGHYVEDLGKALGFEKLASDADAQTKWVVVDFASVMVHVFEPATRAHYDLEMLWGDAVRVPWRRPANERGVGGAELRRGTLGDAG